MVERAAPDLAAAETMTPLAVLLAQEAIRALKARYFRLMDICAWQEWRDVFTPDAVMDMRGERDAMASLGVTLPDGMALEWRGADAIASAVSGAMQGVRSVHHGHMAELEVLSPVHARGIWAMEDLILNPSGAPVPGFRGYGHYHETYAVHDGGWRIASTRLVRLLLVPVARTASEPSAVAMRATA